MPFVSVLSRMEIMLGCNCQIFLPFLRIKEVFMLRIQLLGHDNREALFWDVDKMNLHMLSLQE